MFLYEQTANKYEYYYLKSIFCTLFHSQGQISKDLGAGLLTFGCAERKQNDRHTLLWAAIQGADQVFPLTSVGMHDLTKTKGENTQLTRGASHMTYTFI